MRTAPEQEYIKKRNEMVEQVLQIWKIKRFERIERLKSSIPRKQRVPTFYT